MSTSKGSWGGYRPGSGRPKGSTGSGRPPSTKTLHKGDPITIVVTGPQPGTPPLAFAAKVIRVEKNGEAMMAVARTEDGTTITLL